MLSKIYQYIIAALGMALAIAVALVYRGKAKYEGAMRKGTEQVLETERKAQAAVDGGRKRMKEAKDNAKDAIANRKYFS